MKKIALGKSNYKDIIDNECLYVDKTLLIKELMDLGSGVVLIPRPRRFGKTLNLSTLKYFFEKTEMDHSYLFVDKQIWKEEKYRPMQGQYPVISISFKDIQDHDWENVYEKFKMLISNEFENRLPYIESSLSGEKLNTYKRICASTASDSEFSYSLYFLSEVLYNHYKQKVMVLIDEYDTPIHEAFLHDHNEYYEKMIRFMRSLLSPLLKDNLYLEKGVLTGILVLAKAGLFSELNNIDIFTLTDERFADKFGFTSSEVKQITCDYHLEDSFANIQSWYNGYTFGEVKGIYNPWSVLKCVAAEGKLDTYWVNTSENKLLKETISNSSTEAQSQLWNLIEGKTVSMRIRKTFTLPEVRQDSEALWSFLLFTGYLTYNSSKRIGTDWIYDLNIPNLEIGGLFKNLIKGIFRETLLNQDVNFFLESLITGKEREVQNYLEKFVLKHMSTWDLTEDESEKSYHMFILGLLVSLADRYQVLSNREAGFGRYDITLTPRHTEDLGCVLEFKKVQENETLESAAKRALDQIYRKEYAYELKSMGRDVIAYGIAFAGKKVLVLKG